MKNVVEKKHEQELVQIAVLLYHFIPLFKTHASLLFL